MSTAPTVTIEDVAQRYGTAWNERDLDAIMAMHAEDSVFQLHLNGAPEIVGADAIRDAFAGIFAMWPDIHFETKRLYAAGELFVHEYVITGTLSLPFPVGEIVIEPADQKLSYEGVDVIPVEDGLVKRKDSYIDGIAVQYQLGLLSAS